MPRPRRGRLLPLDAKVLDAGAALFTPPHPTFIGLDVARLLGRERSTVYKSLHRLVALGLLEDEWAGGRRHYRLTEFGRTSLPRAPGREPSYGPRDDLFTEPLHSPTSGHRP